MAKAIDVTVEGIEGTIVGFRGRRDSRIAYLVVDGIHLPCDNVATAKCLHACFGNFIVDGHSYDENAIIGKRIRYTVDDFALLDGLIPVVGGLNEVN
jgi:hypothetical protein